MKKVKLGCLKFLFILTSHFQIQVKTFMQQFICSLVHFLKYLYFCLSTSASSSSSCRRMQLTRCVVISSLNVFTLNQLADSLLRMSSALTHVSLRDHIFGNFSSRVIFSSDTVFSVNKILSYFCTDHYILSKPAVLNLLSLAYPK